MGKLKDRILLFLLFCILYPTFSQQIISLRFVDNNAGYILKPDNVIFFLSGKVDPKKLNFFIVPSEVSPSILGKYKAKIMYLLKKKEGYLIELRGLPIQKKAGAYNLIIKTDNKYYQFKNVIKYRAQDTYVVLIIDSSYSMRQNDPDRYRIEASKMIIEKLLLTDTIKGIGIISFSGKPKIVSQITRNKNLLLKSLTYIYEEGRTNINGALNLAYTLFPEKKDVKKIAILLTDGKNEPPLPVVAYKLYIKKNIPIYTIGLSKRADIKLLKKISSLTGGKFFSTQNAYKLINIFQKIGNIIQHNVIIKNMFTEPTNKKIFFPVDSTIRVLYIDIMCKKRNFSLIISTPDNTFRYPDHFFPGYVIKKGNNISITILEPLPGIWSISSDSIIEDYQIGADSDITITLPDIKRKNNTIHFTCFVGDNEGGLNNSSVFCYLKIGKNIKSIRLFDDGRHQDNKMNDGMFARIIKLENKVDTIYLKVSGKDRNFYPFLRTVILTTDIFKSSLRKVYTPENIKKIVSIQKRKKVISYFPETDMRYSYLYLGILLILSISLVVLFVIWITTQSSSFFRFLFVSGVIHIVLLFSFFQIAAVITSYKTSNKKNIKISLRRLRYYDKIINPGVVVKQKPLSKFKTNLEFLDVRRNPKIFKLQKDIKTIYDKEFLPVMERLTKSFQDTGKERYRFPKKILVSKERVVYISKKIEKNLFNFCIHLKTPYLSSPRLKNISSTIPIFKSKPEIKAVVDSVSPQKDFIHKGKALLCRKEKDLQLKRENFYYSSSIFKEKKDFKNLFKLVRKRGLEFKNISKVIRWKRKTRRFSSPEVKISSENFIVSWKRTKTSLAKKSLLKLKRDVAPPTLRLIKPKGFELLQGGKKYQIKWIASGIYLKRKSIEIYFSTDMKNWRCIITSYPNKGIFYWDIPQITTNRGFIKIVVKDIFGNKVWDINEQPFSIDSTSPVSKAYIKLN